MTMDRRVNDHQKRRSFPFKMHFRLSANNSRFPRYRRVKESVIFDRFLLSPYSDLSLALLASLTYSRLQTSDRHNSWKNIILRFLEEYVFPEKKRCRSLGRGFIRSCLNGMEILQSLYLANRLRYRNKTKSDFNGTVSSIFFKSVLLKKIFKFFPPVFHT